MIGHRLDVDAFRVTVRIVRPELDAKSSALCRDLVDLYRDGDEALEAEDVVQLTQHVDADERELTACDLECFDSGRLDRLTAAQELCVREHEACERLLHGIAGDTDADVRGVIHGLVPLRSAPAAGHTAF